MTAPSPRPLPTAAANAARMRKRQERLAAELRSRGWTATPPPDGPVLLPEVHQDPETRSVFIRLDDRMGFPVRETRQVHERVNLDFDDTGKLVGVEVI